VTFLIRPAELAHLLAGPTPPVVLDVQFALGGPASGELYAAGHLPGAPHLPLEGALAGPPGLGGRHPLPDPRRLEAELRRCGVDDDSAIVVYDQQTSLAAARAWWILRWAGLGNVRVLDGGLAAWVGHRGPVSTQSVTPRPGTVSIRPGSLPHLDTDEAAAWAAAGRLLDVRTRERYLGETEPIDPVAGHIPGARNLPMGHLMRADGTFADPATIATAARAHGLAPGIPIGTSCGSGVTAAQAALALAEAGFEAVPYIGSWSAWITDPSRPVARG